MSWFLTEPIDYEAHNAEVRRVWEAYQAGRPYRVPVSVHGSIRNYLQNPDLNATGYTFQDFFENPEAQIRCQLEYQKYARYHLLCDREMGPPESGWQLGVDFQNSYEAGWFGCPLVYDGHHVPDTLPVLREEPGRLYELECPDPLHGGLIGRALEFCEYMEERCPDLEFEGRPVLPPRALPGEGTDGPLDVAYKLRGATEVCLDMLTAPDYYHDLMSFLTDCIIRRMKALREWRWERYPDSPDCGQFRRPAFGFADDAIVLLSVEQYAEFVLPYHRRLVEEFSDGGRTWMHLCGDAQRFFPLLHEELNVYTFDTGWPFDPGRARQELGPEVEFNAGPTVMVLRDGPGERIRSEVRRFCESGLMEGGRFVLIAANNLAPLTPVEHVAVLYGAAREYGRYD